LNTVVLPVPAPIPPQVPKTSYLSPQEILLLDDKELNQIMSLKKLAPYRDDAAKVRPNYKALQAAKGSLPSQPMWKKQKALKQQQQQQQQQQQRVRPAWQVERQEDGSQPQNGQVEGDQEQPQQQDGGDGGQQQQQQQRLQGWKQHSSKHHHHHQQQQRPHGGHSGKHGSHHSKHHKQQQQRLDPAAKQQARVESYAKLSLKRDRPSGDHQQQQHTGTWQQRPQKKQKKEAPPLPEGRLAKVAVDVSGLTPAQKKNLKRALKRKEAKGQA
jgi:protein KRI1